MTLFKFFDDIDSEFEVRDKKIVRIVNEVTHLKYEPNKIKKVSKSIFEDFIKDPYSWNLNRYTLKKNQFEIWIANDFEYYSIYSPFKFKKIGFLTTFRFHRQFKKYKKELKEQKLMKEFNDSLILSK